MNTILKTSIIITLISVFSNPLTAQCAEQSLVYSFDFNGKIYEVIRDNKTWVQAAQCAVERGGYLTEINSQAEQDAIFAGLGDASITISNTRAFECGTCSFVWIGGHDSTIEGNWIWDGANDGEGPQFWMGDRNNGEAIDNLYNNWGNEPDNFNNQDRLALALNNFIFGVAGQWNDLTGTNTLYYVIEYNSIVGIEDKDLGYKLLIYPNPTPDKLQIINRNQDSVVGLAFFSAVGQKVKEIDVLNQADLNNIDISALNSGVYFLNVHFQNGKLFTKKIMVL